MPRDAVFAVGNHFRRAELPRDSKGDLMAVNEEVVNTWLKEQSEHLSKCGLAGRRDEMQYLAVVGEALRGLGRTCPPTKEVQMVLRLYADPRVNPREFQQTVVVADATPVCYMKRVVRPSGPVLFGYDDDMSALEDLPKNVVDGTTDVPPVAAFDVIYEMGKTTADVAKELVPNLLRAIWHRRPAVVVPFGQSGSGKTFTLEGTPESGPGVVPRLICALFAMIRSAIPSGGPRWCCMVQVAEVYKDQRLDLSVDRGDIVFDRLKPWSLLIVKGRKLQLALKKTDEAGYVVDEAVLAVDEQGKDVGAIQQYKKTLFDLTLQTLKERLSGDNLMQLHVQREEPAAFFEHLQTLWNIPPP